MATIQRQVFIKKDEKTGSAYKLVSSNNGLTVYQAPLSTDGSYCEEEFAEIYVTGNKVFDNETADILQRVFPMNPVYLKFKK